MNARPAILDPAILESVRRHDPDRFLCALFAPADRRDALLLLYAFNHELARARTAASQPILALMRLQWWREVVEGAARRHEVATPLAEALAAGRLRRDQLAAMIDGRALEAEPELPLLADFQDYVRATAGALAVAAGGALGADAETLERLRALGCAYGVAGQLRNVAVLARQGRCLLPAELLSAHGLSPGHVIAAPESPRLVPVRAALRAWGLARLGDGRGRYPRAVIAAALPAVLARRDFAAMEAGRPVVPARGLGDRLAVVTAAIRSRVA